jgi:hypothetical protein
MENDFLEQACSPARSKTFSLHHALHTEEEERYCSRDEKRVIGASEYVYEAKSATSNLE